MISSLLGARLTYFVFHIDEFREPSTIEWVEPAPDTDDADNVASPEMRAVPGSIRWLDIINPFQSDGTIGIAGLVFLGGVVFAIPTAWFILRRKKIPFYRIIDVMVPSLALGIGIARIGCFLNGCCYGLPTDLPWGVVFPGHCAAGSTFPDTHIHPTQVYAMLYCFAIAGFLLIWTKRRKFEGELFAIFLILYGIARGLNESIRFYRSGMILVQTDFISLTISMVLSIIMVLSGIAILIKGFGRVREENEKG